MIEILYIAIQVIFILSLTYLILPSSVYQKQLSYSLADALSINSIFLINILLLFSFTDLNGIYLLIILLIASMFFLIKKNYKLNINYKSQVILVALLIFFLSIPLANTLDLGWDAKFFWFLKTLNFYQDQGIYNLNRVPAFDYPHLGSYIWSFFWKFPFNKFEYLGRIYYICFYVISIFSFFEIFKISNLQKIILIILTILTTYSLELFSGNQEVLIFSLVLLSAKFSYSIFLSQTKANEKTKIIFFLLLILNAASWIKMEGFFFVSFALFAIFVLANISKNQKIILITGVFLVILSRLLFFKIFSADLESFQFEKTLNTVSVSGIIASIKIIAFYAFVYLAQMPILLIGVLLFVYNFYMYKIDKIQLFICWYAIFNILFIFAAFIFSMENVEWQVRVGLKRVIFQTSGFYLLTLVYLLNKISKK